MNGLAAGQPWRWPAEWEHQSAVLLAWPTADSDWDDELPAATACYVELIDAIRQVTPVVLCLQPGPTASEVVNRLRPAAPQPLALVRVPYSDTWLRDTGPITLLSPAGPGWLDFRFNAWDGGFASAEDNKLIERLRGQRPLRRLPWQRLNFVLEGGAIDTDGEGTILATARCQTARVPHKTRPEIEALLCAALRCQRVLWLQHGGISGDDTDGHVDTLVRFVSRRRLVYQGCTDRNDPQFDEAQAMREELTQLCCADGQPYKLFELPTPTRPLRSADGERLPVTYANFLLSNGVVFMPSYDLPSDQLAAAVLSQALPDFVVQPVDCRALLNKGGSLHCVTMQLPAGVVEFDGTN